ncbi:MAG: macro domain-containing protein [Anaerolineae bacterium]|nr:macro domain-containing protein [Anaerolineae bacterium]
MPDIRDFIITDREAIQRILDGVASSGSQPLYNFYLGAGASAEAGIPKANDICQEIFVDLFNLRIEPSMTQAQKDDVERQLQKDLDWANDQNRYANCIKIRYPDLPKRVDYFRQLLQDKNPSFGHHALALLIEHEIIKSTCLTTNFDKLIEKAFAQQGKLDCQALRTEDEFEFWVDMPDRAFVFKIHGDYDTGNIRNIGKETRILKDFIFEKLTQVLNHTGLVVLGAAASERNIITLFTKLIEKMDSNLLRYGILWGIFVDQMRPQQITEVKLKNDVADQLLKSVSPDLISLFQDYGFSKYLRFFPVWGTGNFLFDIISRTQNPLLLNEALSYLDQNMRVRYTLVQEGFSDDDIDKHIKTLNDNRAKFRLPNDPSSPPDRAYWATNSAQNIEIRVMYGDIANYEMMNDAEFQDIKRAVVSPDDTFLSVGGGVAEILVEKAGRSLILNELRKFGRVKQGDVAVTSAGKMPVHYVFHGAATEILPGVSYNTVKSDIFATTINVLKTADALDVSAIWMPLLATGTGGVPFKDSFEAILEAIVDWQNNNIPQSKLIVMIYIFKPSQLKYHEVDAVLRATLPADYTIFS